MWVKMEVVTFLISIPLENNLRNDALGTLLVSWQVFQKIFSLWYYTYSYSCYISQIFQPYLTCLFSIYL